MLEARKESILSKISSEADEQPSLPKPTPKATHLKILDLSVPTPATALDISPNNHSNLIQFKRCITRNGRHYQRTSSTILADSNTVCKSFQMIDVRFLTTVRDHHCTSFHVHTTNQSPIQLILKVQLLLESPLLGHSNPFLQKVCPISVSKHQKPPPTPQITLPVALAAFTHTLRCCVYQ